MEKLSSDFYVCALSNIGSTLPKLHPSKEIKYFVPQLVISEEMTVTKEEDEIVERLHYAIGESVGSALHVRHPRRNTL